MLIQLSKSIEGTSNVSKCTLNNAMKLKRSTIPQIAIVLIVPLILLACSFDGIVNVDEPEIGTNIGRDQIKSKKGAMSVYYSAIKNLSKGYSGLALYTGVLTDELRDVSTPTGSGPIGVDSRTFTIVDGIRYLPLQPYANLHAARTSASQSRYLLASYSDSTAIPFIAHAYAIEGYSILLLAEALCSGFPISQVPFEGDVVLSAGVSTVNAFKQALAKFDSALALSHDSVRYVNLARVGKGRTLLNLGEYQLASEAVSDVPSGFTYNFTYTQSNAPNSTVAEAFWTTTLGPGTPMNNNVGVGNSEGMNGLIWIAPTPAGQDPRVPVTTTVVGGVPAFSNPTRQNKYPTGTAVVPLARDIDARLIEVEALYNDENPTWLNKINELRATRTLSELNDPGSHQERVNMIFRERALWNFLLGQRHGDLRRMIRQYDRTPQTTFPTGTYHNMKANYILFGEAMVFTPDRNEQLYNYRYTGCENYDA